MISMNEILKKVKLEDLPEDHQKNLAILLERVNLIRGEWGKPMTVTSGYRSKADQIRIYKEKGVTDESKIPMKSRHLSAEAVDIYDPDRVLQEWILMHEKRLEEIGLWCEDFSATPNWVHMQIQAPKSGKRFFMP